MRAECIKISKIKGSDPDAILGLKIAFEYKWFLLLLVINGSLQFAFKDQLKMAAKSSFHEIVATKTEMHRARAFYPIPSKFSHKVEQ